MEISSCHLHNRDVYSKFCSDEYRLLHSRVGDWSKGDIPMVGDKVHLDRTGQWVVPLRSHRPWYRRGKLWWDIFHLF